MRDWLTLSQPMSSPSPIDGTKVIMMMKVDELLGCLGYERSEEEVELARSSPSLRPRDPHSNKHGWFSAPFILDLHIYFIH